MDDSVTVALACRYATAINVPKTPSGTGAIELPDCPGSGQVDSRKMVENTGVSDRTAATPLRQIGFYPPERKTLTMTCERVS